jgi:hypothetical protein
MGMSAKKTGAMPCHVPNIVSICWSRGSWSIRLFWQTYTRTDWWSASASHIGFFFYRGSSNRYIRITIMIRELAWTIKFRGATNFTITTSGYCTRQEIWHPQFGPILYRDKRLLAIKLGFGPWTLDLITQNHVQSWFKAVCNFARPWLQIPSYVVE